MYSPVRQDQLLFKILLFHLRMALFQPRQHRVSEKRIILIFARKSDFFFVKYFLIFWSCLKIVQGNLVNSQTRTVGFSGLLEYFYIINPQKQKITSVIYLSQSYCYPNVYVNEIQFNFSLNQYYCYFPALEKLPRAGNDRSKNLKRDKRGLGEIFIAVDLNKIPRISQYLFIS